METIYYKGFSIEIDNFDDGESPREWDNTSKMVCNHRRYNLGDLQYDGSYAQNWVENIVSYFVEYYGAKLFYNTKYENKDKFIDYICNANYYNKKELALILELIEEKAYISNLYLYDHSGITISMSSFGCSFDSGQVGFIYIMKDEFSKYYEDSKTESELADLAFKVMSAEVETYDQYLRGEVYAYTIECGHTYKMIGGCAGFYGYDHEKSGLLEYAHSDIDCFLEEQEKEVRNLEQELYLCRNW